MEFYITHDYLKDKIYLIKGEESTFKDTLTELGYPLYSTRKWYFSSKEEAITEVMARIPLDAKKTKQNIIKYQKKIKELEDKLKHLEVLNVNELFDNAIKMNVLEFREQKENVD